MATPYKIVFDCADPNLLAEFWAEALGYVVEDNSTLIKHLLDTGTVSADAVVEVDGRPYFQEAVAIRDPDDPFDPFSGSGRGGRVLFQVVPEAKTVKNRVHLDLHVGADRRDAVVARLTDLGGRALWEGQEGPSSWVTMADPEGNEFCVA
jgi:hypothetical protein